MMIMTMSWYRWSFWWHPWREVGKGSQLTLEEGSCLLLLWKMFVSVFCILFLYLYLFCICICGPVNFGGRKLPLATLEKFVLFSIFAPNRIKSSRRLSDWQLIPNLPIYTCQVKFAIEGHRPLAGKEKQGFLDFVGLHCGLQLFRKLVPCRKLLLVGYPSSSSSSSFVGHLLLRKSVTRFRGHIKS